MFQSIRYSSPRGWGILLDNTAAMDNRTVDQFVSEDFELDTDSESDTEDEHKTEKHELQIITDE